VQPMWELLMPMTASKAVFVFAVLAMKLVHGMAGWVDVTPAGVIKTRDYGTQSIVVDPRRPSDLYTFFMQQGIYKSTDFGASWFGPINTGSNGSSIIGSGGITVADGGVGKPPILYLANIRGIPSKGTGVGFWRSLDGGVNWETYVVNCAPNRQDVYPPSVDPGNSNHLIMNAHELDAMYQSFDGGKTWSNVKLDPGMYSGGGTSFAFFIESRDANTTSNTWLYLTQENAGTWRTSNGGVTWTKVDKNTHAHGSCQIYQSGGGVVYMSGVYSDLGWGVLRSSDYGVTWTHVGPTQSQNGVFGTPNNVYSMFGWACANCNIGVNFISAPQPGINNWKSLPFDPNMNNGGEAMAAVTFDGKNYIIVTAQWLSGLWRWVEPSPQ